MAQQIAEITKVPTNAQVIKILNEVIKRYNSLGSIYTFKGSVQTYDDLLAIENPEIGDVYNVIQEDEEHQIAAGSNFVWDGTVWDNLGGSLAGLVQSVNGINPDSLGNVLLPLIKNVTAAGGNIVFTKNDNTNVNVNNVKKLYVVQLGADVDLNDLIESGVYMCGNNSYAANYKNCPIQKAFLLEVQATAAGNFIFQFLTQYNDGSSEAGNQYVRTYQATNGWSAWRMAGSGSNLTTYTSLEQLGITPGQETFESIHNALPINSVLEYAKAVLGTYNDSIYPGNYGYFKVTKHSEGLTEFTYINYSYLDSTNNVGTVYSTYYNTSYPNGICKWNKHYTVEIDGTLAKQSDLTDLSNSVVKSVNGIKPTNGNVNITGVPTGTILPFAGNTVPEGFLACNGAAVSRTTYAALFSAIGTTYGGGNGSSTFNLPNLTDKFIQGSDTAGTVKSAGLPNITGTLEKKSGAYPLLLGHYTELNQDGALWTTSEYDNHNITSGSTLPNKLLGGFNFDASRSNSIYGNSTTVQPPALTMRYIIKY